MASPLTNPAIQAGLDPTLPALDLVPVTPSDSTDLATPARSIRCLPSSGSGGTVRFTSWSGQVRNTEIATGETLPVFAVRIHATGTTATGLEAVI
jgi:hypothetical protein